MWASLDHLGPRRVTASLLVTCMAALSPACQEQASSDTGWGHNMGGGGGGGRVAIFVDAAEFEGHISVRGGATQSAAGTSQPGTLFGVDACFANPCENGASCTPDGSSGFSCVCAPGYEDARSV